MATVDQQEPRVAEPVHSPIGMSDLRGQFASLRGELAAALTAVAEHGQYVLGPQVAAFEAAFAAYLGAHHCVGVNSGTSALHLALIAAGVGPGDEVITVPLTFVATAWAICYVGARPVFVDVDPVTYTLDPAQVEARITSRTRAILPVHLYGQAADLDPLQEIADRHGLPLIEDAAQAHGAEYRGAKVGTFGLAGCFSFYPGKNLGGAGEGGAVVTNSEAVARRIRSLRSHAEVERHHHDELGFNYRMDGFQGAALGVKLPYLEGWTERRRRLAAGYDQQLQGLPLALPIERPERRHVWHLYVVLHPERERLRADLAARGITCGLHYPVPLHLQRAFERLGHRPGEFPVTERICRECLSLPLFPELTSAQQEQVVQAMRESLER